jgi:hypothetical protein
VRSNSRVVAWRDFTVLQDVDDGLGRGHGPDKANRLPGAKWPES